MLKILSFDVLRGNFLHRFQCVFQYEKNGSFLILVCDLLMLGCVRESGDFECNPMLLEY